VNVGCVTDASATATTDGSESSSKLDDRVAAETMMKKPPKPMTTK